MWKTLVAVLAVFLLVACSDDDSGITGGTGSFGGTNDVTINGGNTNTIGDITFFDPTRVHTIKIEISPGEWSSMSNDLYKSKYEDWLGRGGILYNTELYRRADVIINGQKILDAGVRVRGNSSRALPRDENGFHWVHWKVSFSQDFAENETVYGSDGIPTIQKTIKTHFGVRGLILKHHAGDASGVKEVFGYDLAERFGLIVPKYTFAKVVVSVNGSQYNYGLYQVIEPIDKQFIRNRYSGASSYLFKCLHSISGPANLTTHFYSKNADIGLEKRDPANPTEAAGWLNNPYDENGYSPTSVNVTSPYRPTYDLKAKKTELSTAANLLDALIQGISTRTGSDFNSWLPSVFDVDMFLKACALNAVLGQWDDFCKLYNNFYLLYRPTDNKWVFIPYDFDHIMEAGRETEPIVDWIARDDQLTSSLGEKVMANSVWADQYKQYVRDLTDASGTLFTPDAVETRLQTLQSAINAAGIGTPIFHDSVGYSGSAAISALKVFVTSRVAQAVSEVGTNQAIR